MGAIDNWANDIEGAVRKYLNELKEANEDKIKALFSDLDNEFKHSEKELESISSEELDRLKSEIDFLLNKCLLLNL